MRQLMDRGRLRHAIFGENVDILTSLALGLLLGALTVWVVQPNLPSMSHLYLLTTVPLLLAIAVSAAAVGAGIFPIWLVVVLPTAAFFPPGCGAGALCGPPSLGTILFDILFLVSSAALIAILGYGLATAGRRLHASNSNVAAD